MPKSFQLVTVENYHEIIPKYISDGEILISEYDDITAVILKMIEEGYCFNMDKNLLRGFLEDFTYMYNPSDTVNKDRIINMLEESDDEEEEEEEEEGMDNMMMNMLMNMAKGSNGPSQTNVKSDDDEDVEDIEDVEDVENRKKVEGDCEVEDVVDEPASETKDEA